MSSRERLALLQVADQPSFDTTVRFVYEFSEEWKAVERGSRRSVRMEGLCRDLGGLLKRQDRGHTRGNYNR